MWQDCGYLTQLFMSRKEEIRGYVPSKLKRLFKSVATLRADKELTISDALEEAITEWLDKPENKAVIKKHRLQDADELKEN